MSDVYISEVDSQFNFLLDENRVYFGPKTPKQFAFENGDAVEFYSEMRREWITAYIKDWGTTGEEWDYIVVHYTNHCDCGRGCCQGWEEVTKEISFNDIVVIWDGETALYGMD